VAAPFEAAGAVREPRPDLRLEELTAVVGEVEARRLAGRRVPSEDVWTFSVEVESARIDDHPAREEVDTLREILRVYVDETDLASHGFARVVDAEPCREDR
jgi:hypothetical protein